MIVTAATVSYEFYIDRLVKSLPDVCVAYYEDTGDWCTNTLRKPLAAEEMWIGSGCTEPLWILDADLEYRGGDLEPLWELLEFADMAVHVHDLSLSQNRWRKERRDSKVSAGIVGFAPTKFGRAALAYWAQACLEWKPEWTGQRGIQLPEQALLYEATAFCESSHGLVAPIPLRFNSRLEDMDEKDIVIAHVPASREMRKK